MKYLFSLLALVLFTLPSFAQPAVIKNDSAEVYVEKSTDSKILRYLPLYTEVNIREVSQGWVKTRFGWIEGKNVISEKALVDRGVDVESLKRKVNPYKQTDSATAEVQILRELLAEERKNQQIRDDVRTMKNITVGMLIISIGSAIVTLVALK